MKILHVTTHFNIGGIANYILTLAKSLETLGTEVIIASSGGVLEQELAKCHIPHRRLNIRTKFEFGPKTVSSGFSIASIVKKEKIDIIHAHTRVSQVAAAIASLITGVPYVTTCHGYFKKRSRGIVDTWGKKVIAISGAVKKHLINDLGVDESRIALIYSGVDASRFSYKFSDKELDSVKKSLGIKEGPVVGTIGRLSSVKGHKFLIAAMKDVIAARPDAQCIIIGNGEEEEPLRMLARSLEIETSIIFADSCPDTHRYLSVMDVFAFPSINEGLGIALLEALASGKACVASSVGGIEDIIDDGINGLLVEPASPFTLAKSILRLLDDGEFRRKIGEEGRNLVLSRFTLGGMADNINCLYKEILK